MPGEDKNKVYIPFGVRVIRVRAAVVRTTITASCTSCKPVVQIEREIQVWQEIITAQGPVNSEVSEDLGETAG